MSSGCLLTAVGVRGRADRGLLYHLNAGVGPAPRRASASSKSTLGGDMVLDGAAKGLWTFRVSPQAGKEVVEIYKQVFAF